jgi:hypothetical protein
MLLVEIFKSDGEVAKSPARSVIGHAAVQSRFMVFTTISAMSLLCGLDTGVVRDSRLFNQAAVHTYCCTPRTPRDLR